MILTTVYYLILIATGKTTPVLTTWLLYSIAVTLAYWTYKRSSTKANFRTNVANAMDVCVMWCVFFTLLLTGNYEFEINWVVILCLYALVPIFVVWKNGDRHEITNNVLNVLMVVAVLPMINHLWHVAKNTEPWFIWSLVVLTNIVALIPPYADSDRLAKRYAIRALLCASVVLALIIRLEMHR